MFKLVKLNVLMYNPHYFMFAFLNTQLGLYIINNAKISAM